MRIGIDMDGVMISTIDLIARELSKHFGYRITTDDTAHRLGEIEGASEYFRNRGEYLLCSIEPIEDAVEVVNNLSEEHEIYIISARYNHHYQVTLDWLKKYGVNVKEVIFTEGKEKSGVCREYGIDLFIEDSVCNALELAEAGIEVILFSTEYNRWVKREGIVHLDSWKEIDQYVKLLCRQLRA